MIVLYLQGCLIEVSSVLRPDVCIICSYYIWQLVLGSQGSACGHGGVTEFGKNSGAVVIEFRMVALKTYCTLRVPQCQAHTHATTYLLPF